MSHRHAGIVNVSMLMIMLIGCNTSPKEYFYTLSPKRAVAKRSDVDSITVSSIVVGPITLPEIVDRPQIVTRVGVNQVAIAEQHRWAASLKSEITQVLAENLSELLDNKSVSSYEGSSGARADIQILLDVQRFDATLGETVTIDSLWLVRRAGGKSARGRSSEQETIRGDGYEGLIVAYSRALATVSRDIAEAIRSTEMIRR